MKEAGGVIFVQDPKDAEFPSMPHSAIATGMADFIASVPELADRIVEVARSKEAVRSLDQDDTANELRRIVTFVHARTGHDFSSYKRATVLRRVLRRMQVLRLMDLRQYADMLQEELEEAQELFRDLLISVTQFFRDPEAFEILAQQAIAPLFDDIQEGGIRAWVPGCATGEEAYSIAILIREEMERRKMAAQVQIFGTDLDDGALATAREGLYPRAIEADLSAERLRKYFVEEGSHYRIREEVRDIVLFASHSVLKDPPFLRLDLVSCRNLMIYLERSVQEKLASAFSYALRPNRYLFVGTAETADAAIDLFTPVNREARLYRSRLNGPRTLPVFSQRHHGYGRQERPVQAVSQRQVDDDSARVHISALESAAPPSVLVGEGHQIVHLSPSAGKFILHSGGQFSGRISSVVRPELRLDLAHALDRAFEQNQPTLTLPMPVAFNGDKHRVGMQVLPVFGDTDSAPQALVLFLDGGVMEPESETLAEANAPPDELRRLHAELKAAKEALARSRAEHEISVQELRAANEELQSMNEEYRSTAEELETSKEELQSMNEELQTVNAELKSKLENISSAHSDLRNLTTANEIGTLFLDGELRIRMFTPPVADLFNVTENDVGRPLTDFTNRLDYDGVERDLRKVLRELAPVEIEVRSRAGRWFMMRVRPYRTIEDRIEGVVVTFVDITGRRETEEQLIESEGRYRTLFDSIDQGFSVIEVLFDDNGKPVDYRFLEVNRAFERQTDLADAVGKTMRELEPKIEEHWIEAYSRVAMKRKAEHFELKAERLGGRCYEVYAFPFGEPESNQVGILFQDISERKEAEHERELLTQELSHRVKNTLAVVQGLASQTSRQIDSADEFRDSFLSRLQALGRAHGLLLASQWRSADLDTLVAETLNAYEAVSIDGPTIEISPKQSLALALMLHELSTNAAKYGALSSPNGRLEVSWTVNGDDGQRQVTLCWREKDGPTVGKPGKKGFGTLLVERTARHELRGSVELKYLPDGFSAEVKFPLD